jgi:hypothetical protein
MRSIHCVYRRELRRVQLRAGLGKDHGDGNSFAQTHGLRSKKIKPFRELVQDMASA